jgi:hypothetical protein
MDGWIDRKSTANKAHIHEHYFFFFPRPYMNIAVKAEHSTTKQFIQIVNYCDT